MGEDQMALPPGFEFDPTDQELIVNFLYTRATYSPCYPNIIPELDINETHPAHLHEKAFGSKKRWYFFSESMQNRVTRRGFWKEGGLSESIFTSNGEEVGFKNYLVFCSGDGLQTNWIMEEFHLLNYPASQLPELVICRVREGSMGDGVEKNRNVDDEGVELSYLDEVFFAMDDDEITFPT